MEREEFRQFVFDLQKCSVAEIVSTSKISKYIEDGLLNSTEDWFTVNKLAKQILCHNYCTDRCQVRVEDKDGKERT